MNQKSPDDSGSFRNSYISAASLAVARKRAISANNHLTEAEMGLLELSQRLDLWNERLKMSRRVLMLDDDINLLDVTSRLLNRALNVRVDSASTANEAIQLFLEHRPAVLIVDLVLAAYDTTSSVEFVRATGRGPRVVFVTGCNLDDLGEPMREMARNLNAQILQKPAENLVEVVHQLLQDVDPPGVQ